MASLEDAMKKAGLSTGAEEAEKEKPADAPKPVAKAPEPVEERPCTKCGTVFLPKLAKHKLCPKCADEHFTAAKEAAKEKGERTAAARTEGSGKTEGGGGKAEGGSGGAEGGARPEGSSGKVGGAGRMEGGAGKSNGERSGRPTGERTGPRPERRDRPPRRDRPVVPGAGAPREGRELREGREPREARDVREPREAQREAPAGFPRDYLTSGYFSGNVLRDEVFGAWARQVAATLVTRGLSAREMRVFYGHLKRAGDSAKAGRDFKEVREEIQKMRPAAAARLGRKQIPSEFAEFLERNIDQVKDPRTLDAFVEHFQGVVGYTAGKLKK